MLRFLNLSCSFFTIFGSSLRAILSTNGNFFVTSLSIPIFSDGDSVLYCLPFSPATLFFKNNSAARLALFTSCGFLAILRRVIFLFLAIIGARRRICKRFFILCCNVRGFLSSDIKSSSLTIGPSADQSISSRQSSSIISSNNSSNSSSEMSSQSSSKDSITDLIVS